MATKTFNKFYLDNVAENIGTMFEHATNIGINPIIFWCTFINSNVAKQLEKGNPKYLNYSALEFLNELYENKIKIPKKEDIKKNIYYWAGWILTQYAYEKEYSFYYINCNLPIEKVLDLYPTLHEADITKFFFIADTFFQKQKITNLKKIRMANNLSQSELSKASSVELRSIQMYEQRKNDINKARADTLHKIAKTLGCNIEDLLEF